MYNFSSPVLLAVILFFSFAHGASAADCPNGGWYCSKLYLFKAASFNVLNAELGPAPTWINTGGRGATFLNNRNVYISTASADVSSTVKNIFGTLQQNGWWRGQLTAVYSNEAAFEKDVADGKIDPSVTTVEYNDNDASSDPKDLTRTPLVEAQDPVRYAGLFAGLAHRHGWSVILAPSCWLLKKMDPTVYTDQSIIFQNCVDKLLVRMAWSADILVIKAAPLEKYAADYAGLISPAALQKIRAGNPYVKILAELSTGDVMTEVGATVPDLIAAGQAVFPYVDGFSFNTSRSGGMTGEDINNALTVLEKIQ